MEKNNKRVAIITGSANGIGKSIAEKFINQNMIVILVDLDEENLKKTILEIDPLKQNTISAKLDISSEQDIEQLKSIVEKKFGYLDILVNNAGIAPNRLIEDQHLDEWEKVIKVNLTGTFLCSKMAVGIMKEKKNKIKYILNITSISGSVGSVGRSAYGVSKAGIIQLTKQMAVEFAEYNILVNSISPGPVKTRLTEKVPKTYIDKVMQQQIMTDQCTEEDILNCVKLILDSKSDKITGENFIIGGF